MMLPTRCVRTQNACRQEKKQRKKNRLLVSHGIELLLLFSRNCWLYSQLLSSSAWMHTSCISQTCFIVSIKSFQIRSRGTLPNKRGAFDKYPVRAACDSGRTELGPQNFDSAKAHLEKLINEREREKIVLTPCRCRPTRR